MRNMDAIIFDRDGVLADFKIREAITFFEPILPFSLEVLNERWEEWGSEVGFPTTLTEEKVFFDTFWNSICDELSLPVKTRQALLQFDYAEYMEAFSDARMAMQYARESGLKVGVLSNFSLASLEHSLQSMGLLDWVDSACAATVIGAAKPAPEAYLTVCKRLDVHPEKCLFLDDEVICVEGARDVGMIAYQIDRQQGQHDFDRGVLGNLSVIPEVLKLHQRLN